MVQLAMKGKIFKNTYKNKHNIEHELQPSDDDLNEEIEQEFKQSDKDLNKEIEKDTNYNDFRTMPRVMIKSSMKAAIKRLQEDPGMQRRRMNRGPWLGKH